MKKLIYILTILLFLPLSLYSQYTLDNSGGEIKNIGTIRVKSGQVNELPDTLGGRIEFLLDRPQGQQLIPNIVYNQLILKNRATKIVGDFKKDGLFTRNLVILDSLVIDDSTNFTSFWNGLAPEDVHAKAAVKNNAQFRGPKFIVLKNDTVEQNIEGIGFFSNLAIDNPQGVNVVNGGGFTVRDTLSLISGQLRNNEDNNFIVEDSIHIRRNVGAFLANKPQFEGKVSLQYTGQGELLTGGEIPTEQDAITHLGNETSAGVTLSESITVNDSLYLGSTISTLNDTLTLATANNPIYNPLNPSAELNGFLRRSVLFTEDTLLLNNPYTFAIFPNQESLSNAQELISEVRPQTIIGLPDGQDKVHRVINIFPKDENNDDVNDINFTFGYGWRYDPGEEHNEMHQLTMTDIVLQNWIQSNQWFDLESELQNSWAADRGWAYNVNDNVTLVGNYAIGLPAFGFISFMGSVILEGAYNRQEELMRMDLATKGYLDEAPSADRYPFNLVPNYNPNFFTEAPDSVVDWIVMEFRRARFDESRFYKTGFVRYDGMIVDQYGNEEIRLTQSDGIDSGGGDYYVIVRHRNHNSIITAQALNLKPINNGTFYNFSSPSLIEGGTNSLKLVDIKDNDERVYAMRAGYYIGDIMNNNEQLDVLNPFTIYDDHRAAWQGFTTEGYLDADYNMDGIVNTRDYNTSWNNRNK